MEFPLAYVTASFPEMPNICGELQRVEHCAGEHCEHMSGFAGHLWSAKSSGPNANPLSCLRRRRRRS